MSQCFQKRTSSNGQTVPDDRHDAGEFITYGQSHGPSSNAYANGVSHGGNTLLASTRPTHKSAYNTDGYLSEGAHAGRQDLRHRVLRTSIGEVSTSHSDTDAHSGRDVQDACDTFKMVCHSKGSIAALSQEKCREVYSSYYRTTFVEDNRELRSSKKEHDCARRNSDASSSNQGGSLDTAAAQSGECPAYGQPMREQQCEHEEDP